MSNRIYKGKRKDDGVWVEGYYIVMAGKDYIYSKEDAVYYEVIPETIGQHTSLTDKLGKKIFEGDIVQSINLELKGVIIFDEDCRFMIRDITTNSTYLISRNNKEIEVIGNIFDNPELLKKGCKDCLHYDICKEDERTLPDYMNCNFYKSKNDCFDAVKCEDCKLQGKCVVEEAFNKARVPDSKKFCGIGNNKYKKEK